MGWLMLIAATVALLPAAFVVCVRQRLTYSRWMAGWVSPSLPDRSDVVSASGLLPTDPLPGVVIGVPDGLFTREGYLALADLGIRLTELKGERTAAWSALWSELVSYVIVPESGDLRIELSGGGDVYVAMGAEVVRQRWESVLEAGGVVRSA